VEHRAIFEAIVASNPAKAKAAAERHVHAGRARLLANFEGAVPTAPR
jgi:DNA-binding GntR family transcriptional regulator